MVSHATTDHGHGHDCHRGDVGAKEIGRKDDKRTIERSDTITSTVDVDISRSMGATNDNIVSDSHLIPTSVIMEECVEVHGGRTRGHISTGSELSTCCGTCTDLECCGTPHEKLLKTAMPMAEV